MKRTLLGSQVLKGRGALSNPTGRFESRDLEAADDGWYIEDSPDSVVTTLEPDRARSIITTNDSPDVPFDYSINPYRGCEHGCVYCVAGDTPILMADGTHQPIEKIRVGDSIFGTVRRGHFRRYVKTQVLAHWSAIKPAYRIVLENGTELVAGADHRFLTERGWKFVTGSECGASHRPHLTTGNKLMGTGAFANASIKDADHTDISNQAVKSEARLKIVSIGPVSDSMRLFDMTTGTEDYIANGVVSHNCYARPSHGYLGLSAGIDFETRLFYKADARRLLEQELAQPGYVCKPITIGANTDPYQPVERDRRVTRDILEVLTRTRHPLTIITKSAMVLRDLDLLVDLARDELVSVAISITTLSVETKRSLEPRTASPQARLRAVRELSAAGIPVTVMVAPVIPAITDHEMEDILAASREAGAQRAGYIVLRLPYEVNDLFQEWLKQHFPDRAAHVMSLIRDMRGGRDYDPRFGSRMRGTGPIAQLLQRRFKIACARLGINTEGRLVPPNMQLFRPPSVPGSQLTLGF